MIIGRETECALLTELLQSPQAEFLVVYGRRRIGKTFLIESFFSEQDCLFFHVTGIQNGILTEHLHEFSREIGRVFYGGANINTPTTWMQAFETLHKAIEYAPADKPIALFFDEFPWMASAKSRLIQALEYYWNRHWKNNPKLKLILCGSSASWIIKKILRHKGGLHNRITQQLSLKPFNLAGTKQFLNNQNIQLSHSKILELYSILGGIPYYLNQIKKRHSIAQNINKTCFQTDGILFDEFKKVFASLFKEHEIYEDLVRAVAKNRHGTSRKDIQSATHATQQGGTLSARLEDLEMAGFIKEFLPISHNKRGLYYRLLDEYSYFYLQWIEPERNNIELDIDNNNYWLDITKSPKYQAWRGYAFESVCYKHIAPIKKALGITTACKIGTWRYLAKTNTDTPGAQIDLLFDREDDAVTLCEIKYSDKPFVITKEYAAKLRQKVDTYRQITRTKKQIFIAMIAAHGIKANDYADELITTTVTLEDLF